MAQTLLSIAVAAIASLQLTSAKYLTHEEQIRMYGRKHHIGPVQLRYTQPGGLTAPNQTLRQAAEVLGRPYIGFASAYAHLLNASDSQFRSIGDAEFNLVTAEIECKFPQVEPQQGQYTYDDCSYVTRNMIANASGVARGHNFVWGDSNPSWLVNGSFTPTQLQQIMSDHISNVAGHYQGQFVCWDAVNEPICDDGKNCPSNGTIWKNVDPWYPALPLYIETALGFARKADVSTKVFVNEYGAEGGTKKADRVYAMAQDFKARGVPLDGIGMQMHISVDGYPDPQDVSANIARLGALGLDVHITEMDIACKPPCGADRLALQAKIYGDMLQACLNNTNCKSFEMWGFTDRYSWLFDYDNPTHVDMQPLPFDFNYNKKPAYFEMLSVLQTAAAEKKTREEAEAEAKKGLLRGAVSNQL